MAKQSPILDPIFLDVKFMKCNFTVGEAQIRRCLNAEDRE